MKDLDFDELDRAVNSLMGSVPKSKPQTSEAPDKVLELDAPAVGEKTAPATPVAAPSSPAPEPAAPAAAPQPSPRSSAPAGRRGGRFMDVVHPSANMKKPDAQPISRTGVTIEPRPTASETPQRPPVVDEPAASDTKSEAPAEPPKVTEPVELTPEPKQEAPVASATEPAPHSDWPDPLDMMQNTPEMKLDETPAPDVEPETKQEPAPADTPTEAAPLSSPFLPDAKVEKRPLGAALATAEEAPAPADEAPKKESEPKTVDDPEAQLPADPTEVGTPLPEELQVDLMAVEADTSHDSLKQAAPAASSEKPVSPLAAATPAEAPAEPTGPTSIPQQYREEKTTAEPENGTIYDTDHYHQPLAHPVGGKPSWLWIAWVAAVLVLGAAGGALLYFLKLI